MFKRILSVFLCAILMLGMLPFFTPAARMAPTTVNIVVNKTTAYVGDTLTYYLNVESPNPYNVKILMSINTVDQPSGSYSTSLTQTYVAKKDGAHVAKATAVDLVDNATLSSNSVTTQVKLRSAPASFTAANVDGKSVKVSWNAVAGVDGYKILYKKSTEVNYIAAAYTTGTSYTKGYLTPGIKYNFKVVGYNLVGSTKYESTAHSAVKTVVTIGKTSITTITSPSAGRIRLTWAAAIGAARYEVLRATTSGGSYVKVYDTTYLAFTNTALASGKTYYFKVKPYVIISGTKHYGAISAYRAVTAK